MMTLVTSIKNTFRKDESLGSTPALTSGATTGSRVMNLIKPVKVPSWSRNPRNHFPDPFV